ncbi:ankyrin repeat domain-containing protein [Erwinia sp. HDF1-3R]|uniref:ankyrin repeat domain-containing protein n=1 Tax=Erwinia sp. HDF1-3R TaxID=3141543 RepID=UPI0031F5AC3F
MDLVIIIKRMITSTIVISSLVFILACNKMKNNSPESYFNGNELILAQEIQKGHLDNVQKIAPGTDLNKPGKQDMTLLFYTLKTAYGEKQNQLKILSEMVKLGANPLQLVPDMGSVAQVVARSDSPAYMNALLEGGMSPNAVVEDTPIIFDTATAHSFDVLKLLVSRGADVNKKDSLGQNVLIEALASMQLDQVEWLLNHGANPTLKTVNGWRFGNMLEKSIKSEGSVHSKTGAKLAEIKDLAIKKGMKWPPASY